MYPVCGPTFGQTQISITGKNFVRNGKGLVKCLFGDDMYTDATVLSSTEVVCDSPAVDSPLQNVPVGITLTGKGGVES